MMKSGSDKTEHQKIENFAQNENFSYEDKKSAPSKGLSLRPNRSVVRGKSLRPKPMLPLRSFHKEDAEGL